MNGFTDRAFRFTLPSEDSPEAEAGLGLTPSRAGRGPDRALPRTLAMVEGDDSVRQALLLLLSTSPGERVMRPRYGCDLRRLAFSPIDDTAAGLAVHYVRQAVERWEPRVEIVRLDATPHVSEPGWLDVFLEYRVRATRRLAEIRFGLDLAGEEA